jgi:hypothetical protein
MIAWTWRWRLVDQATIHPVISIYSLDLFSYFYPMLHVGFSSDLRLGHLFLWNPNQGCGMPGLATLQAGFLYPPHAVYLFLPTATGMGVMALFHIVLAGLGMLILCRSWKLGWLAAVAGASYFTLLTVLPLFTWPSGMEAAAWLPLGVAAIERLGMRRERHWVAALIFSVAMPVVAGGYQTAVAIYYCYALFMLAVLIKRHLIERAGLAGAKTIGLFAVGTVVGVLIAAPQILPTLELSRFGERTAASLSNDQIHLFANSLSSTVVLWSTLFVPPDDLFRLNFFLGIVASTLAVIGLIHARRCRWLLVLLVAFGVLSLNTPGWFLSFRTHIPVLSWFRLPMREFFVAHFAVSLLLAFGIDLLATTLSRGRAHSLIVAVTVALLTTVFCLLGGIGNHTGVVSGLVLLLVILVPFMPSGSARAAGVVSVLFLLAYDTVFVPVNRAALPYVGEQWRMIHNDEDLQRRLAILAGYDRSLVLYHSVYAKHAMVHGTFSPIDYDPMIISGFYECLERATLPNTEGPRPGVRRLFGVPWPMIDLLAAPSRRCLDLVSVRFAAVSQNEVLSPEVMRQWAIASTPLPPAGAAGIDALPPYVLIANANAVGRAYGVYAAECLGPQKEQYQRVLDHDFDPKTNVVLEDGPTCTGLSAGKQVTDHPAVQIVRHEDTEISIEGEFAAPGFLVLTDSYYPGWSALVNGEDAEIFKANAMSRAVKVPEGKVSVVFRYRPYSLYAGCGLAIIGVLLGLGCWRAIGREKNG